MILIKSDNDIQMLTESGRISAKIIQGLQAFVRPGVSTEELDNLAEELMKKEAVVSAFKNYKGFPASICTSVNDEIVHGIPGKRILLDADILSIDVGINYQGYYSDTAVTVGVGKIDNRIRKLLNVTRGALTEGIKKARIGNHLSDISYAIQNYVERYGFSVVRDFVGHGVGFKLHEEPEIPNFGRPNQGPLLEKGMVFAIEPMVNWGTWEAKILDNGWTAATRDGKPSAHFEHTVAITDDGPKILTC